MSADPTEKREHDRVTVSLAAEFGPGRDATVVNLSIAGACLQHHGAVGPGDACTVGFALNDEMHTFPARVVWSRALPLLDGGDEAVFHTGVAFERLPAAAKSLFDKLLAAADAGGTRSPTERR